MQRRTFIKHSRDAFLFMPILPVGFDLSKSGLSNNPTGLQARLIQANDSLLPGAIASQITDKNHKWYGGCKDSYEIPNAGNTASMIKIISAAYVSPPSSYFKSEELKDPLMAGIQYLLNTQYEDGAQDLHTTNFHSTPDTAFRVEPLAQSYQILSNSRLKGLKEILSSLKELLLKAGKALSTGGIHTANHRWVVCMALAHLYYLFPHEEYLVRVNTWLKETIDIDPDGQYTERSTTVYSPTVDRCLITIARYMDKPELLDHVRKNLEMTLYYIRPNGEVVTEASGRQDQYQMGNLLRYYYPYRYMALKDNNGLFASVTRHIESTLSEHLSSFLIYFLEDPSLLKDLPVSLPLPENYTKHFSHSQLARIRRNQTDATILAQNHVIFSMAKGNAILSGLRVASAFFGKGQFKGESLAVHQNEYILEQSLTGPYYQPLQNKTFRPESEDFGDIKTFREQSEIQQLHTRVHFVEKNGKFEVTLAIDGTDNVPVSLELGFREGGELQGVVPSPHVEKAWLLKEGYGKYTKDDQEISFGPGIAEHSWTQLRGAMPKLEGMSVYLTGYTPFNITLYIA